MRLGELFLEEKLLTQEALDEALESQVIHGGRLGTNLVELGLVQEKDLARLLGKQFNAAFASGEMTPDPQALKALDANFADQNDVLPMRIDQTRISVAVIDPHDLKTLDTIAFKTGRRVVPVVIPEFRMNQLLRRHCKAFRNMRAIDMNAIRPSKALGTKTEGKKPVEAADLINEEEFQALYAQALVGGAESPPEEEVIQGTIVEDEPELAPPPAAVAQPQLPAPVQPIAAAQPNVPVRPTAPAAPVAPQPTVLTPLGFAEAQAALSKSSDRNDIARTVVRFALSKWKRVLLLSVQGDLVTGWHGAGEKVNPRAVGRIGISLKGQNTFKLVRDLRSHYVGPMKRDASTLVFYKLLGGGYPTTAVLLPLLVRGKVVHILYVDNGPDQLTPPDVGELLILSQSVARSYEALLRQRTAH